MNYRDYGKTGKQVSEIGFGAWQLGNVQDWSKMSDEEAIKLVHEALKEGVNFFDTAPNYGLGKSETLLGVALKNHREDVVINTKFGHHANDVQDFSVSKIRSSIDDSLKRLQTDYLDSVIIHNPPFEVLNNSQGHFDELEKLKEEGKILTYGASVDSSREMLELIEHTNVGIIEVMYNVFYQEPHEAILKAKEKGIGIIVKVPLDSGWLSGKYDKHSTFKGIRSRWSKDVIERRASLVDQLRDIIGVDADMPVHALQFILAHPGVATVIPGTKSIEQLRKNVQASNDKMDPKLVQALKDLFLANIKNNPLPW